MRKRGKVRRGSGRLWDFAEGLGRLQYESLVVLALPKQSSEREEATLLVLLSLRSLPSISHSLLSFGSVWLVRNAQPRAKRPPNSLRPPPAKTRMTSAQSEMGDLRGNRTTRKSVSAWRLHSENLADWRILPQTSSRSLRRQGGAAERAEVGERGRRCVFSIFTLASSSLTVVVYAGSSQGCALRFWPRRFRF